MLRIEPVQGTFEAAPKTIPLFRKSRYLCQTTFNTFFLVSLEINVSGFQDDDDDDDDDDEIPLDMEEVEAASKKARQDEDIHSEHVQVS